jgi:DNA-binding NtrC family response regulator
MDYLLNCDSVRIVAARDRRNWNRRFTHPLEGEIRLAARTRVPVLISANRARAFGIAAQIHSRSERLPGKMVAIDCAVSPHSCGMELGRQDLSDVGTLVLLDVEHMPRETQVVVRTRLTDAANGTLPWPRPRLIVSSSANLFRATEMGRFDADLFYRLNTIHITPDA